MWIKIIENYTRTVFAYQLPLTSLVTRFELRGMVFTLHFKIAFKSYLQ